MDISDVSDASLPLYWEEAYSARERNEVYRFRYNCYFAAREHLPGTDHAARKVVLPHDARSTHYLARTGDGKLAAVGTATPATDLSLYPEWRVLLELPRLALLAPRLVVISRVILGEEHRGSTVFGRFCLHMAKECVAKGFHYAAHYCAPALVPLYERMGYRLYGKGRNLSGGGPFRLPMLLIAGDIEYMRRLRSPFCELKQYLEEENRCSQVEKALALCPELNCVPLCALAGEERRNALFSACPALASTDPALLRRLERGSIFALAAKDVLTPAGENEGTFMLLSGGLRAGEKRFAPGSVAGSGAGTSDTSLVVPLVAEHPSTVLFFSLPEKLKENL